MILHKYAGGKMAKPKIAICYDFDQTLSTRNMQEFDFMKMTGMSADEFWEMCAKFTKKHGCDNILTMMKKMIDVLNQNGVVDQKSKLEDFGKTVEFFDGVETWFERINNYAEKLGVEVKHYIISSGIKEIIEGTSIAKYFDQIYACYYAYDDEGRAIWPAIAINYTNKTQFLYRINKGIYDVNDHSVNNIMDHDIRPVPFENFVYIGDSSTDIPSMRTIMKAGGNTICVYDKNKPMQEYIKNLLVNDKVNFVAEADYSKNSDLEKIVKGIIKSVKDKTNLKFLTKYQKSKIDKK